MQFIHEAKQKVVLLLEENASTLLTAGGVVGTVATGVLAAKAAFSAATALEAEQIIQAVEVKEEDESLPIDSDLPKLDKLTTLKIAGPYFIPPVLVGSATIGSIIMAHRMSAQKIAAFAAAYGILDNQFGEYKEKVTEKLTGPKKQAIDDELAQDRVSRTEGHDLIIVGDGEVLCFDEFTGRYFKSTMENVKAAVNATNAEILRHEYALAQFFYDEIGLPKTTWSEHMGWNVDNMLDVKFSAVNSPDGRPAISINFNSVPVEDYLPKHY